MSTDLNEIENLIIFTNTDDNSHYKVSTTKFNFKAALGLDKYPNR